ncbi:Endoplasmic reticulum metallopeptidase 1 [Eumeta japonica]|uniref:FXNA-like protease n=1 Tax=Eumeta variegata TaxID=151549 RepID=A0A4C1XUV4_EUMVA|nr:Endoplasmic reticulum metallopeptidase 1 [Eumeta japonica]
MCRRVAMRKRLCDFLLLRFDGAVYYGGPECIVIVRGVARWEKFDSDTVVGWPRVVARSRVHHSLLHQCWLSNYCSRASRRPSSITVNWEAKANGEQEVEGEVKENRLPKTALPGAVFAALLAAAALGVAGVARLDAHLPVVLTRDNSPSHKFRGDDAYEHLLNLTAIGPRVAGSYENEVAAVAWAVRALRIAAAAADAHHHRLEVDVQTASGAFPVAFLDGMTNAYRGVQSVVARLSARGNPPGPAPALLLNCHLDTVPDSPGASDDGAGCAVLVELARTLASSPHLLRHDILFLFNGAEENIMQASHAFITQHRWARDIRAFINLEACGSGGRELLFQAGPHHPWIIEAYADYAPHPYASSLAQEIFESGLIPADTDFRIFRDFGNLSGVDIAWSSNGYVYHTRLDDATRVPPASLQRAGENVLALAMAIVQSGRLSGGGDWEREAVAPQPLFFDLLGGLVIRARPPLAALAAALALAAAALALYLDARQAARALYMRPADYWALVWRGAGRLAVACGAGLLISISLAAVLTATGATLAWYSQPMLLVPLYVLPALAFTALLLRALWARDTHAPLLRGWWAWRATGGGALVWWAALLTACAVLRLHSGFVPMLWTAGGAGGTLAAHALQLREGRAAAAVLAGITLPSLQSTYLSLSSLQMFVPLAGRVGAALPTELAIGALVSALALSSLGWVPALALATSAKGARCAIGYALATSATAMLLACSPFGFPYTQDRPKRVMMFETRRTLHYSTLEGTPALSYAYWMPDLDAHSPRSLLTHGSYNSINKKRSRAGLGPGSRLKGETGSGIKSGAGFGIMVEGVIDAYTEYLRGSLQMFMSCWRTVKAMEQVTPMTAEECSNMLFCGAPYYLPVLSFISRAHWLPIPEPAHETAVRVRVKTQIWRESQGSERRLHFNISGPSHVVVIVAPAEGARLSACSLMDGVPIEGPRWGERRTYFFFLHTARGTDPWVFNVDVVDDEPMVTKASAAVDAPVDVSVAGHALFGELKLSPAAHALLTQLPTWTAPTGWAVDLHLYRNPGQDLPYGFLGFSSGSRGFKGPLAKSNGGTVDHRRGAEEELISPSLSTARRKRMPTTAVSFHAAKGAYASMRVCLYYSLLRAST